MKCSWGTPVAGCNYTLPHLHTADGRGAPQGCTVTPADGAVEEVLGGRDAGADHGRAVGEAVVAVAPVGVLLGALQRQVGWVPTCMVQQSGMEGWVKQACARQCCCTQTRLPPGSSPTACTWSGMPSPFKSTCRPGEARCSRHTGRPLNRCTASSPSSRCATTTLGAVWWGWAAAAVAMPPVRVAPFTSCTRTRFLQNALQSQGFALHIIHALYVQTHACTMFKHSTCSARGRPTHRAQHVPHRVAGTWG